MDDNENAILSMLAKPFSIEYAHCHHKERTGNDKDGPKGYFGI